MIREGIWKDEEDLQYECISSAILDILKGVDDKEEVGDIFLK